jgi:hypothetical protein
MLIIGCPTGKLVSNHSIRIFLIIVKLTVDYLFLQTVFSQVWHTTNDRATQLPLSCRTLLGFASALRPELLEHWQSQWHTEIGFLENRSMHGR